LTLQVETLCIHGDSEGAAATALDVREALEEAGFEISRTA
jgi:lactam utilization protein B